jgi:hypothetical protein
MSKSLLFRFAKPSDARHLAELHMTCGKKQIGSFMPLLGLRFLTAYYKILLSSEFSVVILAYCSEEKEFLGFHSGSIDAKEMRDAFSKAKFQLGWTAITSFWFRPKTLYEIIKRHRALQSNTSDFIIKDGARGEYWAWKPGGLPPYGAAKLHKLWHHIMYTLGCEYVRSEVNVEHARVRKVVIAMGGKVISETTDLNGQARVMVEYDLARYCKRFPLDEEESNNN